MATAQRTSQAEEGDLLAHGVLLGMQAHRVLKDIPVREENQAKQDI